MADLSMTHCIKSRWSVVLRLLQSGRNQVDLFWTGDQREGMQSDAPLEHIGNDILEAIFDEGLRITHARRCIAECLETFAATEADFTIDGLYAMAHARDYHVGRATVYRTVETLVRLERVDRIRFADGMRHYRVSRAQSPPLHLLHTLPTRSCVRFLRPARVVRPCSR